MTFRTRVIVATVVAASLAVILACSASYFTTRNSLMRSVDESLTQAAHSSQVTAQDIAAATANEELSPGQPDGDHQRVTGAFFELVLANGTELPTSRVPIDQTIQAVAKAQSPQVLRTVSFGGGEYRQLIVPIAANAYVACPTGICQLTSSAAELFMVSVTGQQDQLRHLARTLLLVASGGLLLAWLLGLFLARTALHPLENVTNEIETVAQTNDLKHRLDEGDADELGRLRRVFNRLLSNVDQSQHLQRQLVLDASHELRTPLTSLRTNAQILSRADLLSHDDLQQITSDMVTQVDELASLVTDLGELARGERSEGAIEPLRLEEILEDLVQTARTHARTKEITIEQSFESATVLGRRDRLTRAISNLLTNAIKFTPAGGRIVVENHGGQITVSDSGPGINPEDVDFIFDRFWRSPSARALPGSGLGLSIVDQVVREFGGTVRVERDAALGGARFVVTLPIAQSI